MQRRWRHVIVNTRCSWLHGDPRGFRDRDHRIHSSGDYRSPPPPGENAGLHRFYRSRAAAAIHLNADVRIQVLQAFVRKLDKLGHRIIACSCGGEHLHALTELPHDLDLIRKIIGNCKQAASHAVRAVLPGTVWSEGGQYKWIKNRTHLAAAYNYIRTKQEPGTVVWSHRAEEDWVHQSGTAHWVIDAHRELVRADRRS